MKTLSPPQAGASDMPLKGENLALTDAVQMAGLSDPGQVRERNEDSVVLCPELRLAILADGIGGQNAGGVASAMATAGILAGLRQSWTPAALDGLDRQAALALSQVTLQKHVLEANNAVFAAAQAKPDYADMGTTLVTCLLHDDFMTVAHLGDSRLYRFRNDVIEQVTRDHSLLEEQIASGMISREDAHLSSNKNVLTRALGVNPDEQAEVHSYEVQKGDVYLLCSDGLHGMLPDEEIEITLGALKSNLELAAQQLVQAANDADGNDNVSVILLQI